MTAAPSLDTVGPTDAELARAAAVGDRDAFAEIYDRYADRLHDFCIGMLRDRDGAADCVQDTFCTAATRLKQLREPDKLRPWLYAIARNEALRRLRERRRETTTDELPEAISHEPGLDTLAARTELADLIAEAAGGLSDRDQAVLELAYRHGLDGPELGEALGVSAGNANKMVSRLRETIALSLGALLVSRRVRTAPDVCPELAASLGDWDGSFSVLMRKRIARHIESCPTCDEERSRLVSPAALLGATPVFIPAPPGLRERTLSDVRLDPLTTPISEDPADHGQRSRNAMVLAAIFVALLLISLGITIAWVYGHQPAIAPAETSKTAPQTASTTAAPTPVEPIWEPPTAVETTTISAVTTPAVTTTPPAQPPEPPTPPVDEEPPISEPPPVSEPPSTTRPRVSVSSRPPVSSSQKQERTQLDQPPKPRTQSPTRRTDPIRPASPGDPLR